jgi:hypothetical protein
MFRTATVVLLVCAVLLNTTSTAQQLPLSVADQRAAETRLKERRKADNGIAVDEPKIYDDSMLQQMLRAAEARLASLQTLDQTGIMSRVGAVAGATQQIRSVGVAFQTPQVPGVTSVSRGATQTDVDSTTDVRSATPTVTTVDSTTVGAATQDVTTTAPAFAPPTVSAPAPSTSLPSSFSVSASDALNEQMQLTYEIANLRLLLEGALSDHVLVANDRRYVKPRVTLGFPIAIDGQDRFDDKVAVVEVEVARNDELADQRPSITTLLPREKTYNVAAITDSSMSIGGGVVTAILGVSGSFLSGRKTYYVTQDQDTVALTFQPVATDRVGFRWQFRPVLGKRAVRPGLKQTFVQIAFPTSPAPKELGTVVVRTYWLKYDRETGATRDVVGKSYREYAPRPIRPLPIASPPAGFSNADLRDLGGGQMFVRVPGRFLTGTYVRMGATTLRDGSGAQHEHNAITFTASINDIATKPPVIVARDGTEEPLEMAPLEIVGGKASLATPPSKISSTSVAGLDDGNAQLSVQLDKEIATMIPPPVLIVGGRVFGYADAPVVRQRDTITARVPVALMISNPTVVVTSLFGRYRLEAPISGLSPLSRSERLVLLEQSSMSSKFLLYGSRLGSVTVLEPAGVTIGNLGRAADGDTLRTLTFTPAQLKHKQIVLQRQNERPFLLAMPPGDRVPTVKARERVGIGVDAAMFDVDPGTEAAPAVSWRSRTLAIERLDARTLRVSGMKAAGITDGASSQLLEFDFGASGKTSATLDVVSSRVETVTR